MLKIGVLLSGCGVYDGAEIQEAVLSLLAIDQMGAQAVCIGIDADQHHVVNHLNGEEILQTRNMLVEAARIARGDIQKIENIVGTVKEKLQEDAKKDGLIMVVPSPP